MEVLTQNSLIQNKLSLLLRIDDFPSLVASKARCFTRDINVNNTWWYIDISLDKWCETREEYIIITPESSDQPEVLSACIWGNVVGNISSDRSFDVTAIFKFKQPATAEEHEFTHKFSFNSLNKYKDSWVITISDEIEVIFLSFHIFNSLVSFRLF